MNKFINPINAGAITIQSTSQIYSLVSNEGMGIFYNWENVLDVMEKTCGISVICHQDVISAYTTACNEIVNRRISSGIYHTPSILSRIEEFAQEGKFFPCTDMIYSEEYYPTSAYLEKIPVFTENIGISENFPVVNLVSSGQEIFKRHSYKTQVDSPSYAYAQLLTKSTSEEIQTLSSKNSSETLKTILPTASIIDEELTEIEGK